MLSKQTFQFFKLPVFIQKPDKQNTKNCPHNNILKESQHKFYSKAVSVNWIGADYKMYIKTFYVMSTLLPSNVFISGDSFYHLGTIYYKYFFSKTMIYVSYG